MDEDAIVSSAETGDQQLSPEVAAHLEQHREVTLFCHDSEGHPIGYPMMLVGVRGIELLFSTYAKSAKVRHMRADPRVAVLSVSAGDPADLSWVSLNGTATIWQPTPE
jgi:general stress protein 26